MKKSRPYQLPCSDPAGPEHKIFGLTQSKSHFPFLHTHRFPPSCKSAGVSGRNHSDQCPRKNQFGFQLTPEVSVQHFPKLPSSPPIAAVAEDPDSQLPEGTSQRTAGRTRLCAAKIHQNGCTSFLEYQGLGHSKNQYPIAPWALL